MGQEEALFKAGQVEAGQPPYQEAWAAAATYQAWLAALASQGGMPIPQIMWASQQMMPAYGGGAPPPGMLSMPALFGPHGFGPYGPPLGSPIGGKVDESTIKPRATVGVMADNEVDQDGDGSVTRPQVSSLKKALANTELLGSKEEERGGGVKEGSRSGSSDSEELDARRSMQTGSASLNMLRKRSFDHMSVDAVSSGGTNLPSFTRGGAGAFTPTGTPQVGTQALLGSQIPKAEPGSPGTSLAIGLDGFKREGGTVVSSPKGGSNGAKEGDSGGGANSGGASAADLVDRDDREVKKERRKQSNRESARRSRMRKQFECEELGGRVDTLSSENIRLRSELTRLTETCAQLSTDNRILLEQLHEARGLRAMEMEMAFRAFAMRRVEGAGGMPMVGPSPSDYGRVRMDPPGALRNASGSLMKPFEAPGIVRSASTGMLMPGSAGMVGLPHTPTSALVRGFEPRDMGAPGMVRSPSAGMLRPVEQRIGGLRRSPSGSFRPLEVNGVWKAEGARPMEPSGVWKAEGMRPAESSGVYKAEGIRPTEFFLHGGVSATAAAVKAEPGEGVPSPMQSPTEATGPGTVVNMTSSEAAG